MKLITVTLKMAFFDSDDATAENVADSLVRYGLDGLYAEVLFTSERSEREITCPDPDADQVDGDPFDTWQEKAREELNAPK